MRSSLVVSECDNAPLQRLKATQLFKTLSDPTRLQILYILAQNQGTNICAIELSDALKVSPPTVTRINDQELPAPANEAEIRELIEAALTSNLTNHP